VHVTTVDLLLDRCYRHSVYELELTWTIILSAVGCWTCVKVQMLTSSQHLPRVSSGHQWNRPNPISWPGIMKVTRAGSLFYSSFLLSVFVFISGATLILFSYFVFSLCFVSLLFWFGCQYQCKWLAGKTRLWNDVKCVDGDVKPTHSLSQCWRCF